MADKGGGSIIQIIHETAYALAKKEMNLKEDDKQDQTKLTILQMKLNQNEEEVIQKVNSILKQIEVSFSGAVIPKGIDMEAATHVLNQVTMNGLTSPSEISIGEDVAKECLISALQSSDREFEDIDKKEFQKSNYIYEEIISEAIKENTTTVEENRPKVIVENPDGRYSIETIQAEQDIEDYKEKAKLFIKNGDMKGLDKFIKSISEGQGNDGTIRAIVELIKEDGGKSTKDIQNLFNSLNLVVKNRDVYEQDISTFTYHIELLVHINRVINSCDNVEQKRLYSQMLENITKIDPKAAKYYQEHPELKNLKSTNELHDAVGEFWNDDEKGKNKDVDSFCKKLDEKIQELSKMNTSRDDTSGKKLNESTISSNTPQYRKSVEIMLKDRQKALPTAIKMLSSQATEDKKDVFQDVIIERLLEAKDTPEINSPEALEQKKKLFEIVIARSMSNEKDVDLQLVNNLITIDSRVVKEILKENLIPAQNDAPSHIMGQYVQAIGEGLKASSPKVLDSEKTPLGKIASTPNALVENVKKVDRTHTDEDEGPEI